MAVALGKNDNAAAARDRPALRGLQAIVLPALRFLDRPTHAFKNAPCQHDCLKARDISELFRGSLGISGPDLYLLGGPCGNTAQHQGKVADAQIVLHGSGGGSGGTTTSFDITSAVLR